MSAFHLHRRPGYRGAGRVEAHRPRTTLLPALSILLALTFPLAAAGADTDPSDRQRIEELEREVERLRAVVDSLRGDAPPEDDRFAEIERQLQILAEELERMTIGEAAAVADTPQHGLGPAASKVYRTEKGVSIGGYGEMIYENFDSRRDDGSPSGKTDQLDFLRAVVYFGYKFNDRWLLNTEIEYEHASTGESGEVAVEFAYLEYRHRPELNVRAGLLLPPMGFLNELHEPTVFLGAKRPETERVILPSTWRENGAGLWGETDTISYRAYVVTGFDAEGFSAGGVRGGRQKGSKAKAEDFAFTGRLDYVGAPGLVAGVSVWHGGSGQGLLDTTGAVVDATTTLVDAHLEYRHRGLELRALAARGDIDDVDRLNDALGLTGTDSVGEEFEGFYLQGGYDIFAHGGPDGQSLIPYVRWETLDTQAAVPSGFDRNPASDREILTIGVAWQPIDPIVLKVDWQDHDNEAGTGTDQVNVLLGYIF